ncbi:Uncharacterized protein FWK35_00030874, partial [Aphis craccivora]
KIEKKKVGKWVPLCCALGAVWIIIIYYRSVKFESNDSYHLSLYTKNDSERR